MYPSSKNSDLYRIRSEVFEELKPYQQKELTRLVLHKAILSPDSLKLCLYGRPPEVRALTEGDSRFQTFKWLPGQMSESVVLWDNAQIKVRRIERGHTDVAVLS